MTRIVTVLFFLFSLSAGNVVAQVKKKAVVKKSPAGAHRNPGPKKAVKAPEALIPEEEKFTRVKISTDLGDMIVKLYNKTPKHRDNFIRLVSEHFYDSTLFHRVIDGFMIQGGDPGSKQAQPGEQLGNGDVGYTIPAEFDTLLVHKRGALCAARTNNPEKASSGCQFYIVQGKPSSDGELDFMQAQKHITYTPAQRMTYKMNGGTPRLDMDYTVFGELESGVEVVDKIAKSPRDSNNRPVTDIRMKMEILQ